MKKASVILLLINLVLLTNFSFSRTTRPRYRSRYRYKMRRTSERVQRYTKNFINPKKN